MSYTRKVAPYPAGVPAKGWDVNTKCKGDRVFDWFAEYAHKPSQRHAEFCASCPVVKDCLRAGLREGQDSAGFRAGLPAEARRRILRAHLRGESGGIEVELVKASWSPGDVAAMVAAFEVAADE